MSISSQPRERVPKRGGFALTVGELWRLMRLRCWIWNAMGFQKPGLAGNYCACMLDSVFRAMLNRASGSSTHRARTATWPARAVLCRVDCVEWGTRKGQNGHLPSSLRVCLPAAGDQAREGPVPPRLGCGTDLELWVLRRGCGRWDDGRFNDKGCAASQPDCQMPCGKPCWHGQPAATSENIQVSQQLAATTIRMPTTR